MRQRNQTTVALAIGGILLALVFPWILAAQEDKFIDCRERSCDVEDIVRALQPQSPTVQYRGIPTTALPAAAIPTTPPPKAAVALNVYFATNSDRIAPKYYAELNKFGEALTRLSSTVEIAGHTDSIGSDQLNQVLSERRARSVKHYLGQHFALPDERLIAKGYGESQPRASNETESGRRQNRRIEVALPQP
jgi:outer membrane protein OmpA-like peptidoglycan-associated protein